MLEAAGAALVSVDFFSVFSVFSVEELESLLEDESAELELLVDEPFDEPRASFL